jgi:hypothetical protein
MSSLQERVAARRKERERERTFVLPVPGYEDVLHARYRPLPFEDLHDLQQRHEDDGDTAEGILGLRADTLARACVELLERSPDGSFRSLGFGWQPAGVREHLIPGLPESATARDTVFALFNGTMGGNELIWHFRQWDAEASRNVRAEADELLGESAPSIIEGT